MTLKVFEEQFIEAFSIFKILKFKTDTIENLNNLRVFNEQLNSALENIKNKHYEMGKIPKVPSLLRI